MENVPDVSSEEELAQLRSEGKISEAEYQELRDVIQKSTKVETGALVPEISEKRSKRKLGKIAFCLLLLGVVLPAVWFYVPKPKGYRTPPPTMPVQPNGEKFSPPTGEEFAEVTVGEVRRGIPPWLIGLFLILEIAAFVMGVIAWPDVFAKATVVTILFVIVLAFLLVIAF